MKEKISLKKNYIMNMILTMSTFIFPLLVFPYVSRILLPVGTGKVGFATSIITYFSLFAQLGIPTYGIRACAKVRDDKNELSKTVQEILTINIITCVITYIAFAVVLINSPKMHMEKELYLILSVTILLNSMGIEWLYKALEMYTYIAIRSVIFKILAFVLMIVLVQTSQDYIVYGGLTVLASSASNLLNIFNSKKYIEWKPIKGKQYRKHLKAIVVFFSMTCATTIYINVDTIMLGILKSDIDVGYYDAAVKVKRVLVSVITSLGTVLLPRVSYYVEKKMNEEFKKITAKALNYVVVMALPLMVFFMLYAEHSIYFLAGKAYSGAIIPMKIIMPAIFFIGVSNILGIQILIPLGKEKIVLYSEIAGAIINIILNSFFIPIYAASGAAFATVVAEFVVMLFQCIYLWKKVANSLLRIQYYKIFFAIVLALLPSIYIRSLNLSNFVVLLLSAVVFFANYIIVLFILKENIVSYIVGSSLDRIKEKIGR